MEDEYALNPGPELNAEGLAVPLKMAVHANVEATESQYYMEAQITQAQPYYAAAFLQGGGQLDTAAAFSETDVSLTGSTSPVHLVLEPSRPALVRVALPSTMLGDDGKLKAIDHRAKINITGTRVGAAINGTLCDTYSGAGSAYLASVLRQGATHSQVPLIYGTIGAHSATVGLSSARIVQWDGKTDAVPVDVRFEAVERKEKILCDTEEMVDTYAHGAFLFRKIQACFPPAPNLTKSVARQPVGLSDSGYSLVPDVVDQEWPYSMETTESLLQHALGIEFEFDAKRTAEFLDVGAKPGLPIACYGQTVAACCSSIATYLMAYRSDGRSNLTFKGTGFAPSESWKRSTTRTPLEANDCDGSALLILSLLQYAHDTAPTDSFPYLRAVRHVLRPYYTWGIGVLGARGAEASGADIGAHMNGHAVAMMIPTLGFLEAVDKAGAFTTDWNTQDHDAIRDLVGTLMKGKLPTTGETQHALYSDRPSVAEMRFNAVFNPEECDLLAQGHSIEGATPETSRLTSYKDAMAWCDEPYSPGKLLPYGLEGTSPTTPKLHVVGFAAANTDLMTAIKDECAFAMAAPNVGRGYKMLHAGLHGHRFYAQFVEISLHRNHPLRQDTALCETCEAANQFVFGAPERQADAATKFYDERDKLTGTNGERPDHRLSLAGAAPHEIHRREYLLAPLLRVDTHISTHFNYAGEYAKLDVVPRRNTVYTLDALQSKNILSSITCLLQLHTELASRASKANSHCVQYMLAYSTLANNPAGVAHFAQRLQEAATGGGLVDVRIVHDLAHHPVEAKLPQVIQTQLPQATKQAGFFVVVNAMMEIDAPAEQTVDGPGHE
tara:strand:+ start:461 stop:2971 length:2511 start_codon:yes stop_codon:yes gene_type:complete